MVSADSPSVLVMLTSTVVCPYSHNVIDLYGICGSCMGSIYASDALIVFVLVEVTLCMGMYCISVCMYSCHAIVCTEKVV